MPDPGASTLDRLRQSRKWPPRWPVRWKIAAVSAGITFFILLVFGLVVGQITTNQLRENYAADTRAKAQELAVNIQGRTLTPAYFGNDAILNDLLESVNGVADLTLVANGITFRPPNTHSLGPLVGEGVTDYDGLQVATTLVTDPTNGTAIALVRYGRPMDRLDRSIGRIWLAIGAASLAATLLAALGGVILSRRAMRPVSTLTTAAGQIARTRDPEVTLAEPDGEDEVAELTRTLNEMLHELSIARTEREKSFDRQREFVADASHELRTPLTSVLANLELLEDSLNRPGSGTGNGDRSFEIESVESALRSSQRMRRLVSDLQLLAKADAGRSSDYVDCDISQIAAHVVAELKPISQDHRLMLDAGQPVVVSGNGDEIHRVILNLIDNAIRHTPPGSTITVTTRLEEDTAELRVEDDGPGVPRDMWPTIFDRFVRQAGPSDRAKGKGTGLGLSIVRVIAQSHGGTASVGTSPHGGASFAIRIPAAEISRKPLTKL